MVTFGLVETSKASAKPRKISVRKKIWEARSKIVSHGVCFFNLNFGKYFKFLYEKIKSAKQRKQEKKKIRKYTVLLHRLLWIDEVQSMYEEEKNHHEYE